MKKLISLIAFTFIIATAFGQSISPGYLLTFDFEPSFIGESEIRIQTMGDSCFLNIQIYKNNTNKAPLIESRAAIAANKLIALTSLLNAYKFQIKNNIDTISFHKEFIHGDSVLVYHIDAGNDGITVSGMLTKNDITRKFAFWSPKKGSENAKLMSLLFDLIGNEFSDKKIVDYIEQLKQYFP